MSEIDRTPTPFAVEIEDRSDAVDSSRPYSIEAAQRGQVRSYRRGLKNLIFPATVAATLLAPSVIDGHVDQQRRQTNAALAEVEAKPKPSTLEEAQTRAAFKLFGLTGDRINTADAQKIAKQKGNRETLDVRNYLDPDDIQVSEDGRTFTINNQNYGLERVIRGGGEYVFAGKTYEEKGFTGSTEYFVSPLLIGGAHNDASSDINKDGVVTPGEVREVADEAARRNLRIAFTPKQIIVSK